MCGRQLVRYSGYHVRPYTGHDTGHVATGGVALPLDFSHRFLGYIFTKRIITPLLIVQKLMRPAEGRVGPTVTIPAGTAGQVVWQSMEESNDTD